MIAYGHKANALYLSPVPNRVERRCARVKTARLLAPLFLAPCLATGCYGASNDVVAPSWSQAAAAHYLDSRESWWQSWDAAKRDHATICVSCHTVIPYALSRSSLRGSLGEGAPTQQEQIMLNNVLRRVTMSNEVQPFYPSSKAGPTLATDSRATESVLNALILSTYDRQKNHLTDISRSAFDNMWALQIKSGEKAGAWNWQNFHLAPWESSESQYNGAVLAAIALFGARQLSARPQNSRGSGVAARLFAPGVR